MQPQNQTPVHPSWDEIFQEIGRQLRTRSGLLATRVLKITLPALITLFLVDFIARLGQLGMTAGTFLDVSATSILIRSIVILIVIAYTAFQMDLKIQKL